MALYKCRACGAPLEVRDGTEVAFCPYCGMKQTLPKDPVQVMSDGTSVESLLKRAFMFLEDSNWGKADEYCDRVLDVEPENARAYLGKLMADVKVRKREDLTKMQELFDKNDNYKKVLRFGNEGLISEIEEYLAQIKSNIALLEAVNRNDTETVKALLNVGADVNFHGGEPLHSAAVNGNIEIVNVLLNAGARYVNTKSRNGVTALGLAIHQDHTEIVKALIKAGANVNAKVFIDDTALILAVRYGHTEIVNILLNAGADVNAKNKDGDTALMIAVHQDRTEIFNALLNAGADVNAKNKWGETVLEHAKRYGHTKIINTIKRLSPTQTTQVSGCMTLILQALTATIIITILAAYL